MQWSLQDNSAAINNEDARAIFNNEFDSDDDDISDDEEDEIEENCLQQEQHQEEPLLSLDATPISMFGSDQKTGRAKSSSHLFNEYSYVDSNMDSISSVVSEDLLDERGHEKIEDEDEDNDLDEDDIYDISLLKNRRKQSFVLNKNTIDFERFPSPQPRQTYRLLLLPVKGNQQNHPVTVVALVTVMKTAH